MGSTRNCKAENPLDIFLFVLIDNFFDLEMEQLIIRPLGRGFGKDAVKIGIACPIEVMEIIFLVILIIKSMKASSQQKCPQEDERKA